MLRNFKKSVQNSIQYQSKKEHSKISLGFPIIGGERAGNKYSGKENFWNIGVKGGPN